MTLITIEDIGINKYKVNDAISTAAIRKDIATEKPATTVPNTDNISVQNKKLYIFCMIITTRKLNFKK